MLAALLMFFIVGIVARLFVTGPTPRGCLPTILIGLIGSFVGGFLGYVLFDKDISKGAIQLSGFFGSLIGSVIVLLIYRHFASPTRR